MIKRTVKCKLNLTPVQAASLTAILEAFASACNTALEVSTSTGKRTAYDLQQECYYTLKETFKLTANHVVRVCARVAASFGEKRPPKIFRPTSLDLDARLFTYNPHTETISISSMDGRLKGERVVPGEYQRRLLEGQKPKAGQLKYDRRGNKWYICMVIETPVNVPANTQPLGVDLGINRIATTSDGEPISGRRINRRRQRYARTRASLQKKGTKYAKRVLKRLSGRQKRFTTDTNHKVSKKIVEQAKQTNSYIVVEDLEGIRERTNHKGRRLRKMIGGWSFYQLQSFIMYKACLAAIAVIKVDPAYTSRTCWQCSELGSRRKHAFSCKSCGYIQDADINAALNSALRGALVFCP